MRYTTNAILVMGCALSALVGGAAAAQTPATELPLKIGARVRVSSSIPGPFSSAGIGTVLDQRAGTLYLRPQGSHDSFALPFGSITQLEVSTGGSRVGLGMGLGFLTGASIGAALGKLPRTASNCTPFCDRVFDPIGAGLTFGLLGTIVGGYLGSRHAENWEQVAVTARKVNLHIAPSGKAGLMVSAIF